MQRNPFAHIASEMRNSRATRSVAAASTALSISIVHATHAHETSAARGTWLGTESILRHDGGMTESDPKAELREIDEQIDQVTRDIDGLRDQLADAGPIEPEERAAVLTNREELEGVLDGLRRRRATVSEQVAD